MVDISAIIPINETFSFSFLEKARFMVRIFSISCLLRKILSKNLNLETKKLVKSVISYLWAIVSYEVTIMVEFSSELISRLTCGDKRVS